MTVIYSKPLIYTVHYEVSSVLQTHKGHYLGEVLWSDVKSVVWKVKQNLASGLQKQEKWYVDRSVALKQNNKVTK
jgi:hypothetical protein